MFIFRKERQSLRIKRIRASRAKYVSPDIQEIHIGMMTEEGDRLDLQLPPRLAHALIMELTTSYQAICPPLTKGSYEAQWQGMDE